MSVGAGFDQQQPMDAAQEWQAAQAEAARRRAPEPEPEQERREEQPVGRFARFSRLRRGSHPMTADDNRGVPAEHREDTGDIDARDIDARDIDTRDEWADDDQGEWRDEHDEVALADADEQWGQDDEQRPETDEYRPGRSQDDATARDDADRGDERMRPIPRRAGRGGFDPDAAAVAQAFRYARRRRVAFTLLIATVVLAAVAVILTPLAWIGSVLAGVLLIGYLVYLRRQVRIEDAIRQRRMARLQRARQIRPEYAAGDARTGSGPIPGPASPVNYHRTRQVVAVDDDDPIFDDLDHYEPIEYRRAVGQ